MAIFTNQATLSYNGTVTTSNVTTGELLEVLSITKTAASDTYGPQDTVTYVVSITNTGTAAFSNLTVTDNLGGYTFDGGAVYPLTYVPGSALYYINGVLQADPAVVPGAPLVFSGISVPAGGNALLVYEARTNQFAPPTAGSSIVNEATVSGIGLSTPISDTAAIFANAEPQLTINKSLSPLTVSENGQLTYTFVIQNTGNTATVATDNATITDLFDPILSDLTVTFNGSVWTEGIDYTYDESTGLFTTVPGRITVPAATYTQNESGIWVITPGTATLTVSGTV
ncbi:MAG: DUF11 domain-containing protein [Ruminococcaceae bacterium]|nr:DUF11 domain-containing protein [Oscillospiraceae bacterium]